MNFSLPTKKMLVYPLLGLIGFWLIACLLSFPEEALQAALKGFSIWWDVLFPSLFPFLVIAEIMLGFGIVHFIGTLLDPMMRPLFRVPGIGGFVMAMGFASGYPVGSKLTAQLREQGLVNRDEGERLVAFTTTSDPIFLIGAVSIGFFHHAGLAVLLAVAHYGSAVVLGLLMRYHGRPYQEQPKLNHNQEHEQDSKARPLILRAFNEMHQARLQDSRNLGQLLQDAVRTSLTLLFVIGGLVVFFAVFMEMMQAAGLMTMLHLLTASALGFAGISPQLSDAVISGLFEVTLGAQAAGAHYPEMMRHSAAVASLVLSWGGLSVHAQIVSLISRTHMRYGPFLLARLIHALLSALVIYSFWPWLYPLVEHAEAWLPTFHYGNVIDTAGSAIQLSGVMFLLVLVIIVCCYIVYHVLKTVGERLKR